jgi:hypothetical protein
MRGKSGELLGAFLIGVLLNVAAGLKFILLMQMEIFNAT